MMKINMVIILFAILVNGVFGDTEAVSVMEGNSVTLNTTFTKQNDKMLWYFEDTRIALINGGVNSSCLYDGPDGRFRHRLKVDYETGYLTIINIGPEHAGRYDAETSGSKSSGKSQTLNRKSKPCDHTKIINKGSDSEDIKNTFILTVSASDSGRNKNKAATEQRQAKDVETTVPDSGLSSAAVAGICAAVVLLVAAAAAVMILYKRSYRNGTKKIEQASNNKLLNEVS